MRKTLIFLILVIVSFSGYFGYKKYFEIEEVNAPLKFINPHFFNDPDISIKNIKVKIVYFTPKNKTESIKESWREDISKTTGILSEFHNIQFKGGSKIEFDVFSEVVVGFHDDAFYNGDDTSFGNPNALLSSSLEIENRIFSENGDLYNSNFSKTKNEEHLVLGVIYNGVGAVSGMEMPKSERNEHINQVFLVSDAYISGNVKNGLSIFYHEFAHTLGLPDLYDEKFVYSDDIMGEGRNKPIENTYIRKDTLLKMGVAF